MNKKQHIEACFDDTFAECQADQISPDEVVDALVSSLNSWIDYHKTELDQYNGVFDGLRKRICAA